MFSRLKDSIDTGRDTLRSHYGDAEERILNTLRDASHEVARRRDAGLDLAKSLSQTVANSSREANRSATELVRQRPVESVVLVAAVAFAAGWLVQRLRRNRGDVAETPAPRTRRRAAAK